MNNGAIILLLIFITSCTKPDEKPLTKRFEDIKGFFGEEAIRLNRAGTLTDKKVKQNEFSETKNRLSVEWQNELALFIESDINKPAWRKSYQINGSSDSIIYTAIDSNLRTRSISLRKDADGRLIYVFIHNITKNRLYESSEELIYIPDSIYVIDKSQKVLLLGKNRYLISGRIRKK